MFEFLFNEPLARWADARLVWAGGLPVALVAGGFALGVLLLAITLYRRTLSAGQRFTVGGLQALSLAALLTMLAQPALLVDVIDAGDNTVAWVLDTSASMQHKAATAAPTRSELARQALADRPAAADGDFAISRYTLGESLAGVENYAETSPPAARTSLARGLDQLLATLDDQSLAAIVLVTDGADNSGALSADWWAGLRNGGVPVYTVGVGEEHPPGDVELVDVRLPSSTGPDQSVQVVVRLRHSRSGAVRLRVTAAGQLLASRRITLAADGDETTYRFNLPGGEAGVHKLDFMIEPGADEMNRVNNRQVRVLTVKDEPQRILYVEGEPRWEYKFLRRAMDERDDIDVVSLLRTSSNKFYRQGVRDAAELANGFPKRREELFGYDAVIIGSLEAAELSTEQQADLRDFVNVRGGSLLMLAGRSGLADGGWGRSVVDAALPVALSSRSRNDTYRRDRVRVAPTAQGLRTPWLSLADQPAANRQRWAALPEVADAQAIGELRAGAVVLLATAGAGQPVLAWHRYGQGQSYVLGTGGTWRWQMSMPSEDDSHERFWQQLLGHMVETSMPRLTLDLGAPVYRDATEAQVRLSARNADYTPLQQASVPVDVVFADGRRQSIDLSPQVDGEGTYAASIPLTGDGSFAVTARTPRIGESPGNDPEVEIQRWATAESGSAEAFDAGLHRGLLERIAEVTGGAYLQLDELDRLPGLLATSNAAMTREVSLPLWNMPILFLLLFGSRLAEWLLRLRWRRL